MKHIHVDQNADRSARRKARYIVDQWWEGALLKLGGATGRTPILVYQHLFELGQERDLDFRSIEIMFLDEYWGAYPAYACYAQQHLRVGQPGGFLPHNVGVPRGCFFDEDGRVIDSDRLDMILRETTGEWEARTEPGEDGQPPEIHILPTVTHPVLKAIYENNLRYDNLVRTQGAGRLQILGINRRAHIGFIEPGAAAADTSVMLVRLSPTTQRDNDSDFSLVNADGNSVQLPRTRYAITQGIATIMTAGQLLLSAHGMSKREAVRRMLLDYPGPQNPAGWIQKHEHVHVFLDVEAFGELSVAQLEECGFQVDMALKEHVHR